MNTSTICQDDQRRDQVRAKPDLNGLDYLEVSDDQLTLTVYFLGKAPARVDKANVRVEGGRRVRAIKVLEVQIQRQSDPELDDWMTVQLDKFGDFSTYTLRLVGMTNIDPRYDHLDFTFKVGCPADTDCLPADTCPPPTLNEPELNYLAKDYASFRQLILDRLALVMPNWTERHVPDLGITLVELLAYVGDYLSYYQDAVATEAYLDTARQRISVRRHARLVDYLMHEGCNARAWVCVTTETDLTGSNALDPNNVYFITTLDEVLLVSGKVLTVADLRNVPASHYEVFEPISTKPLQLYQAHNSISFYTWGNRECCLPRGATTATLKDAYVKQPAPTEPPKPSEPPTAQRTYAKAAAPLAQPPAPERQLHLAVGDVLIFEEVIGPKTGDPADADPMHRQAVRLTRVEQAVDELYDQPIVEIEWAAEDALRFPLCLSAISDAQHGCVYHEDISIARGNVVLVDHGRTLEPPENLGEVPLQQTMADCDCESHPGEITTVPGRFRPQLQGAPLTFRQPLAADASAMRLLIQDPRAALPQIKLSSIPAAPDGAGALFRPSDLLDPTQLAARLRAAADPLTLHLRAQFSKETLQLIDAQDDSGTISGDLRAALLAEMAKMLLAWSARFDLLSSGRDDPHFVAEMDNDGRAHLRFGNGELGRAPQAGASFLATYRVGNGVAGNVGAEAIALMVLRAPVSGMQARVRNPLPALGGTEPEPMAEVKLFAPTAFRKKLQRAITAADYAQLVQRDFTGKVQSAATTLSWSGSWYEAQVAIDPLGSEETNPQGLADIKKRLARYRRIGHDLTVQPARYVSLDVELIVCVLPHYLRGHVEAALRDVFSNRVLPNGRLGFFHPDNLTFGGGIYLSKLVATAQAVKGVESVRVSKLERLYEGANRELENGVLPLNPLEVARLDNDPSFPEHGRLTLDVRGGR